MKDHRYGGLAPFFIDWFALPAPGNHVAERRSVGLGAPRAARSGAAADDDVANSELDVAVTVANGDAELAISFDSPRGVVAYTGRAPAGFTLRD